MRMNIDFKGERSKDPLDQAADMAERERQSAVMRIRRADAPVVFKICMDCGFEIEPKRQQYGRTHNMDITRCLACQQAYETSPLEKD